MMRNPGTEELKKKVNTVQILDEVPGMVHCVLDLNGNDIHFPEGDMVATCILKHPGQLTFYTEKGENCLSVMTELGCIALKGRITKREHGFITFQTESYKIIMEENGAFYESAFCAQLNFCEMIKRQKMEAEFKQILHEAVREELKERGLDPSPIEELFIDWDEDENGDDNNE